MTAPTAPMVFTTGRFERILQVPITVQADARRLPRWCPDRATSQVRGGEAEGNQDRRGVRSAGTQQADGEALHCRPLTSTQ